MIPNFKWKVQLPLDYDMFLKGGTHLTHRTPKNVRLQRYDHDHVGNRAERVKIVECYGRSKVMLRPGRRPRPPSEHGLAGGGLLLGSTNQSSAQTLSSSGDL